MRVKLVPGFFMPQEWTQLAFQRAMKAWERSAKRPDLSERDRVHGALLAYQSQLDACMMIDNIEQAERR